MDFSNKTLEELEFNRVLDQISYYSLTKIGKENCRLIRPSNDKKKILNQLNLAFEFSSSFENKNQIPNHNFNDLNPIIKILNIEDSSLDILSFKSINIASNKTNKILFFLRKFKEYYPLLNKKSESITLTKEIINSIDSIIDKNDEIKNSASKRLNDIRIKIKIIKSKISQTFNSSLNLYLSRDLLDEIKETTIENRRVLAVKSMFRKKVKGQIMGRSKTGSIIYIEPENTLKYSRELITLLIDESEEIELILKNLTNNIRSYIKLICEYQDYLVSIDVLYSIAKYSVSIKATLPKINNESYLSLLDAYHPLLYINNKALKAKTYPQTLHLGKKSKIMVISGPNAGGKSITLKTVGLIQLMMQSGILIPVNHKSSLCVFDKILTDIGDNQSIENQLSTYSYRLKNMKYFIDNCDQNTLFLIDEFGTGSDPELGGALAESILEEFYNREALGIITTHYSNLKLLANELSNMTNANMQFNSTSLEPIFKLIQGEAGSSFTFEVAKKNDIPNKLIDNAKSKINSEKIRFDESILKLQKERKKMMNLLNELKLKESKKQQEINKFEVLNEKTKSKLIDFQSLFEHKQKMIDLGNKINIISEKYFIGGTKRVLISEFIKIINSENSKMTKKKSNSLSIDLKTKRKNLNKSITKKILNLKKGNFKSKVSKAKVVVFNVGDDVRLIDGKSVGTIDLIEKKIATVNYGTFITKIKIDGLELVKKN